MKKWTYVWKESIYKNGFKCACGNVLADSEGNPSDNLLFEDGGFRKWLYCDKCLKPVAYLRYMNLPEDAEGMMGNIEEYEKKRRMN